MMMMMVMKFNSIFYFNMLTQWLQELFTVSEQETETNTIHTYNGNNKKGKQN